MKKLYVGKREVRPHELILADQESLKGRWLCLNVGDLCAYDAAKAQSPEAGEEFLARRKERNRIEAKNPPTVKPTPPPKPALPPLVPNETMVIMQKIAQDGVLLDLDENNKLAAQGWRPVAEKWEPQMMANWGAIEQTLRELNSTHGDADPLNLRELADETNYYRECDRLRELERTYGFWKALPLYEAEKAANLVYVTFPEEPAE